MSKKKEKLPITFYYETDEGKAVPLVVRDYHTYLDTGMIPWNPKSPSRKAKDILKLLGLSSMISKEKI
jgi:hypothetical protein